MMRDDSLTKWLPHLTMLLALPMMFGYVSTMTDEAGLTNFSSPRPEIIPEYHVIKGIITDVEYFEGTKLLIFTTQFTKYTVNDTLIIIDYLWDANVEIGEMHEFKYLIKKDGTMEKTPESVLKVKPKEDATQ